MNIKSDLGSTTSVNISKSNNSIILGQSNQVGNTDYNLVSGSQQIIIDDNSSYTSILSSYNCDVVNSDYTSIISSSGCTVSAGAASYQTIICSSNSQMSGGSITGGVIINGTNVSISTPQTYIGKTVNIDGKYTLPTTDGTSNQVMTSNGAGVASWKTLHLSNANTADVVANAADTYLTGSRLDIGGKIKAGTTIIFRGHMTKNAAGIATPIFNVRFGTNGTTMDAARHTFTGVAQTAATDTGWFELRVVIRSVSATSTSNGGIQFQHFNTTTGLANKAQVQIIQNTSGTYDNTSASLIVGLSVNPGTSAIWTFQQVSAEAYNLL